MDNDTINALTSGASFITAAYISANVVIGTSVYLLFKRKITTPSELENMIEESNQARRIFAAVTYPARYFAKKAYERNSR